MTFGCGLRGTGSAVPERRLTNDELSRMVDTNDEWITQRTGIKERRIAADGESTSDFCIAAGRRALEDAGVDAADIDLVIVGTVTPDQHVPATSCLVQHALGCTRAAAFDVAAGCSGFVYVLNIAAHMLKAGAFRHALCIGAECLSRITNYEDRTSCILFGDAAGAVVLSRDYTFGEVRSTSMFADGEGYDVMYQRAGGARYPITSERLAANEHKLVIRGREVYKFAVSRMVELVRGECAKNPDLQLGAIVPHQVNQRIIEAARERLDVAPERVVVNIQKYGNTSAASIPVALDEARREGFFDDLRGQLVVMCAFGAGLTWGSVGLKW